MTVTTADEGRLVTWQSGNRPTFGVLHRCPSPGSVEWLQARGKATVLLPPRPGSGLRQWAKLRPDELEVVEAYAAPPPGSVLHVVVLEIPNDHFPAVQADVAAVLEDYRARLVVSQMTGPGVSLVTALEALTESQREAGRATRG